MVEAPKRALDCDVADPAEAVRLCREKLGWGDSELQDILWPVLRSLQSPFSTEQVAKILGVPHSRVYVWLSSYTTDAFKGRGPLTFQGKVNNQYMFALTHGRTPNL